MVYLLKCRKGKYVEIVEKVLQFCPAWMTYFDMIL